MITAVKGFVKVETKEMNEVFEAMWKKVCEEKEFIYVSKEFELLASEGIQRFLILDKEEQPVATVEFVQFNPGGYSILDHYFKFSEVDEFVREKDFIYEIGKLSIDRTRRNEGILEKILLLIGTFAKENNVKTYLAATEGWLYRRLVRFGFPLTQLADELEAETYSAVPMSLNLETSFEQMKNNRWLQRKFANR